MITDAEYIETAIRMLKDAREMLRRAGCPKSSARVRLALSSARGALANARHRLHASERGEQRRRIRRAPKMQVTTIR